MFQLTLDDCVAKEHSAPDDLAEELRRNENWRKIPLLNYTPLHELRDGSLVRFRGMIQDMLDNETYLEQYEVVNDEQGPSKRLQNGKYRDCYVLREGEVVNHSSDENVFGERRTMFVVSIPGLNDWAVEYEKRVNTVPQDEVATQSEGQTGQKRALSEDDEAMDIDSAAAQTDFASNKKVCTAVAVASGTATTSTLSPEYLLNSPIPERPSKACMVKIYSNFDKNLLNTLVDVIGFLSVNPAMDASTHTDPADDPYMEMDELVAANPPPSLIPRLHAIAVRPMEHMNPMLDNSLAVVDATGDSSAESVQKDLLIVLTQCLFGDTLAAEYLLAHLISTVYVRTEMETLGQFALNICNIPSVEKPTYTQQLYEIIASLLPASHNFQMSLDNLNCAQFVPKKDYKTNKLTSGLLQLAPHTHLVLDETHMNSGGLHKVGMTAVHSLVDLIKKQETKCDFEYYQLDYHANIAILQLSEGKTILPTNATLYLKPDPECVQLIDETLKAAKHYLQPKLNAIRKYLTNAKLQKFEMNQIESKMIENDFVEMRKSNKSIGADELHTWLVFSRLLGIARGKTAMDKETWELAKTMEKERMARIPLAVRKN